MADGQLSTVLRQIRHLVGRDEDERTDGQLLDAFLEQRDEAAFASVVRRHGPMVLGVCRRVLADAHAAEDAFQATFLVLFRRARALDRRGSVAGWLYTVAYHAALKARASMARHARYEKQASTTIPTVTTAEVWDDLRPVLDGEMNVLPEKYRLPGLLCYVEGKTTVEAARLLGWPAGTLKSRLAQARELLRRRLTRRGITVTTAVLSAALGEHAAAVMPSVLVESTVQTVLVASGTAALATPAAKLAASVLRGMALGQIRAATLVLLGLAVLGLGGGIWARQALRPAQEKQTVAAVRGAGHADRPMNDQLKCVDLSQPMAVRGQVVGPDGKPVPHARLAILVQSQLPSHCGDFSAEDPEPLKELTADANGRFHWQGRRPPFGTFGAAYLLVKADGFGLTWIHLNTDGGAAEPVIRLYPERILRGRLYTLQGQPAAGVRLEFGGFGVVAINNFDGVRTVDRYARLSSLWPAKALLTDGDGRFTVRGFDGRQNVSFDVRDPRFAMQPVTIPASESTKEVTKVLVPGQTIEGTVVAADTGKLLPHARLLIYANDSGAGGGGMGMSAAADAQGHFRVNPWRGRFYDLSAFPPEGTPYLVGQASLKWPKGAIKQTIEVRLPHGVLIHGKITEAGSGRPVARASVLYWPGYDNQSPLRNQVVTGWQDHVASAADGTFALAVLPGSGTLFASGPTLDFMHEEIGMNELYIGKPGGQRVYPDAIVRLNLPAEVTSKEINVRLRRGVAVKGSILGPDGKPVAGALVLWRHYVRAIAPMWRKPMKVVGSHFELAGLDPDVPEDVYFLDPKNRNGATVHVSGKSAAKPLIVQLQPCGQATVRYVNADGKPLPRQKAWLSVIVAPGGWQYDSTPAGRTKLKADGDLLGNVDPLNYWHEPLSGADGRCMLPALIPGCRYHMLKRLRKGDFR